MEDEHGWAQEMLSSNMDKHYRAKWVIGCHITSGFAYAVPHSNWISVRLTGDAFDYQV